MLELTVRVLASLAVVVGLLLLLTKLVGRRFTAREGAPVQVLHRQALSRTTSVAVLSVGSRVLLVGTTDQQVRLLTELDPDELDLAIAAPAAPADLDEPAADRLRGVPDRPRAVPGRHRVVTGPAVAQGALAGSVLSAQTWREAFAAATGKRS